MLNVISGFNIGSLHVSFYGILMAVGMALGVLVACFTAKKRGLKAEDILLLACYVLPLAVIGARIYYVIFSPGEFTSFVQVLKIWEGGLAIYGGVIGGAIGVGLFCLIHKKNFFAVADIAVCSLILGQAIGRIGCFFAGCCYGIEVTDPSLMKYPIATEIGGTWHYATFFYESFWNFLVFAALMLTLYLGKNIKERGVLMSMYLILYGTGRAIIETYRGDSLYLGSIKVSQLLSILLIVAGITIISLIYIFKYAVKKPLKIFEFPAETTETDNVIAQVIQGQTSGEATTAEVEQNTESEQTSKVSETQSAEKTKIARKKKDE